MDFLKRKMILLTQIKCVQQVCRYPYLKDLIFNIVFIIAVGITFYNSLVVTVIFIPYLIFKMKKAKVTKIKNDKEELNKKFQEGMQGVSFALNAGYSIENAFRESLEELKVLYGEDDLIVREFKNIIFRINRNENIETIILDFARKSDTEDILYFAEVFKYAKRSGGDLVSIIRNTSSTIRQKIEVKQEIETVISGKKMEQKIMSLVPFGIILYLRVTAPELIDKLYGNVLGIVIMTVCFVIYMLADMLAEKIVDIRV